MEEDEVHAVPRVVDTQPLLAADEREVSAKLEEERLQVEDQCLFQVALGVLVLEVQELEDEGTADLLVGADTSAGRARVPVSSILTFLRDRAVRS